MKEIIDIKIETVMIENNTGGFANCYIGLPKGHPWHKMHYEDIEERCSETSEVHGGLTYSEDRVPASEDEPKGLWWVGFDTKHDEDNKENCDREFCEQEIVKLVKIAMEDLARFQHSCSTNFQNLFRGRPGPQGEIMNPK